MKLTVEQLDKYEEELINEKQKKALQIDQLCIDALCELNNKIISELNTPGCNFVHKEYITNGILKELSSFYQDCIDILWTLRAKILLSEDIPDNYLYFEHTISDDAIRKVCQEFLKKDPKRIKKVNYMKNILF